MSQTVLKNVGRWSRVLEILTIVAMVLITLALVLGAILKVLPDDVALAAGRDPGSPLSLPLHLAVLAAGALPAIATIWTLNRIRVLFALYRQGMILTPEPARTIRAAGAGLLAIVVLNLVARPLQVLFASLANGPGDRVLAISVASADLGLVIAGGLLVVIGQVMAEAAKAAEENRGFV